ncbi:MAG: hypothetical protein H0X37_16060 [Herpetosiphonaceae bacterium]|nr:hypothetical protein [Herpetosiphonaceae bacterium]
MLSANVLRYGVDAPLPPSRTLRAGPLSLVYEAGDLRYIKHGTHEVLRRVYVAIRDHNWSTVLGTLSAEEIDVTADSFHISYTMTNQHGPVDFHWQGTITGDRSGTITWTLDGEAHSTFLRNRIGFCILHPAAVAGARCHLLHVDGTMEETSFPLAIAPQRISDGHIHPCYPFAELQRLAHEVTPALWAEVGFAGDIFELEDQRNWIDGSFKTYSTPLRLPYPVEISAGTRIQQRIILSLKDSGAMLHLEGQDHARAVPTFNLLASEVPRPLSHLGLGSASHGAPLSAKQLSRLRLLHLSHLRVDLVLNHHYAQQLQQATGEAHALGIALEIALFLSDPAAAELRAFRTVLEQCAPRVSSWLIFHVNEAVTTAPWIMLAREHLTDYSPEVAFAGGTNMYFTDLNRGQPPIMALDRITYSVNPQVHAFDNASLVEAAATIAATVDSARQFSDGKPVMISPVTLKPRFNPVATEPQRAVSPGELPPQIDPRQMSLFGAAWTLTSLKYVMESAVTSVTYYQTSGPQGVMAAERGVAVPAQFHSLPGSVFPLYHVFADIGEFASGSIMPSRSDDPLVVDGLALRKQDMLRIIIANLTNSPQQITVALLSSEAYVRYLDETNAEQAMADPEMFRADQGTLIAGTGGKLELHLLPYAIACIDNREEPNR